MDKKWEDSTICIHAGCRNSSSQISGRTALWQTSGYDFESLSDYQSASHFYRRYGSPNSDELASVITGLEAAEAGLATSSGMGAILAAVLGICNAGDIAIVNSDAYGVTLEFFSVDLRRFGVEVEFADVQDLEHLDNAIKQHFSAANSMESGRKVIVFVESISNPMVKVADVPAIANVCKKYRALLIVDNTIATPLRSKPLVEVGEFISHSFSSFPAILFELSSFEEIQNFAES